MKIGFIGLGKMGSRMVEKMLKEGHEVFVWNRTKDIMEQFHALMVEQKLDSKLALSYSVSTLVEGLGHPKIVWSMLPAGVATQSILDEAAEFLSKDDILIDGGNSYYKDTQKRYDQLKTKGIKFLGIGVSGGIHAITNGYPFMVGGDESAYEVIKPLLDSLSKPTGGYEYFGTGGAGHFVKMVHNGIEYGMMQAIGEGFGVLQKSEYQLDLLKVAKLYQKNTIVSGFLMDMAASGLEKDPTLSLVEGIIAESGEAAWTVEVAKQEQVPIENIEQSLEFRRKSQTDSNIQQSTAAKMVATLRHEFGGHEIKKK
jgi:6-phosphogluconate dehydrogenase